MFQNVSHILNDEVGFLLCAIPREKDMTQATALFFFFFFFYFSCFFSLCFHGPRLSSAITSRFSNHAHLETFNGSLSFIVAFVIKVRSSTSISASLLA